ncbi:PREDICTED: uncharacterized protein LOC106818043 [Priapulus caudatus]|uniref:Uncharacterized protein LOC106818043 n=1 Tax=Priapulus caudatus TaxID=37621 RepID=A0ABM1F1C3_PRICU|nr:PREDICTED: uncharacterized protein LOC106818043 [Priapulus caudatus]
METDTSSERKHHRKISRSPRSLNEIRDAQGGAQRKQREHRRRERSQAWTEWTWAKERADRWGNSNPGLAKPTARGAKGQKEATAGARDESHVCGRKLNCGCEVEVIGSVTGCGTGKPEDLPVEWGLVGDKRVQVLRDTGCSGVVVRRGLVREEELTGKTRKYMMMDRTIRKAPLARVYIKTPFLTGEVEALCLDRPIYDVVIGNVRWCHVSVGWRARMEHLARLLTGPTKARRQPLTGL